MIIQDRLISDIILKTAIKNGIEMDKNSIAKLKKIYQESKNILDEQNKENIANSNKYNSSKKELEFAEFNKSKIKK